MMQLFDDALFQMFAERALMTMTRGGAEYGECAATAARITSGDVESWYREWFTTAARVEQWGDDSASAGHGVSAREAYLRASTYYRISFYPLFGRSVDPRLVAAFDRESRCFDRFAALMDPPLVPVEVPFEGTSLPGYLCLVDGAGVARPTLVAVNGYDSNIHEMYWSHAVPALRRGYNCLLVDGPGQGRALITQQLPMRPNWDTVLRPITDFACTRPEIDRARIAVMGWSFGGFLAPRGAAGNDRIAALIVDPGQWDPFELIRAALPFPPELAARLPHVDPNELEPYLAGIVAHPLFRWRFVQRGLWVHGLDTLGQYVLAMGDYRLSDVVHTITCPTFVGCAESDPLSANAERLYEGLTCPKTLVRFSASEGADGHCEGWNRSRFDQKVFDWLDETLRPRI